MSGADPGFSNRGGAKNYGHAEHIPSVKHGVPYGWDGIQDLPKGPEALGFEMLSV